MQEGQTPTPPPGAPQSQGPGAAAAGPPPQPPRHPPAPPWPYPPQRPSPGRRILRGILACIFLFSIVLNFYLLVLLAAGLNGGFERVTVRKGQESQTIAIYRLAGAIDGEASERFRKFYGAVNKDNVKAVVIRVESPGGGMAASDQIHNLVKRLKANGKKVVVSMGGIAASGGYYVSAPADQIVAEPTTITGSIGVIMVWPILSGTLEKIGIEMVLMKSSHAEGWKDEISQLQKPDSRQRKHLQELLDKFQAKFEDVVRSGRGERLKTRPVSYTMRIGEGEEAKELAIRETAPLNGKIYLSEEAKEFGLIDEIGYLSQAVDLAAKLAKLDEPKVVRYEVRRGLLVQLIEGRTKTVLDLDVKSLDEFQTPRVLLMWKAD